jgi:hypothetical protein
MKLRNSTFDAFVTVSCEISENLKHLSSFYVDLGPEFVFTIKRYPHVLHQEEDPWNLILSCVATNGILYLRQGFPSRFMHACVAQISLLS